MDSFLGTTAGVWLAITVIIVGFAAYMTGQAIAGTWRPYRQLVLYSLLLAGASRFLIFGLFGGRLFSPIGYLIDLAVLLLIGSVAFRLTRARKMVSQYPWLYHRAGPFAWRPHRDERHNETAQ
jgi:Domain of unknown function (DUF6867)